TASDRLAPLRSASRRRTPRNVTPLKLEPGSDTNDQSPLWTVSGRSSHSVNELPMSLHPVNSASKKLHRLKVQRRKAESVWREALKRTLPKVHCSNRAPCEVASVRSTSKNEHSSYVRSPRSSP